MTGPLTVPYLYRRRVHWGDGDPGLIVYTVRFLDYAMEAADGWFRDVVGADWYTLNTEHGIGTPVVHLEMNFSGPLRPGDLVHLTLLVGRLGRSSLALEFHAAREGGAPSYTGQLVLAFVDNVAMRSIPVPERFRRRIEDYRAACAREGAQPPAGDA